MKPYFLIAVGLGLALLAAACDRSAAPTAGEPRAVTGTVEVKLGDYVQRFAVRVDRAPTGFLAALRPLGSAAVAPQQLAQIPFVKEGGARVAPLVVETPQGTVETRLAYRPLGPWHVLDRAVTSIRVRTPTGERTIDLEVALREPRLEP